MDKCFYCFKVWDDLFVPIGVRSTYEKAQELCKTNLENIHGCKTDIIFTEQSQSFSSEKIDVNSDQTNKISWGTVIYNIIQFDFE